MDDPSLKPTELIPLINIAWNKSFARMSTNKQAIADRGWNPLNYNLLLNSELRATMTRREKLDEPSKVTLPPSMRPKQVNIVIPSSNNDTNISIDATEDSTQQSSLNFSNGFSADCITSLISNEQLMEARERIKSEKSEGEDLVTRLTASKRLTAGFCWKEGTNRLGKTIFEVAKEKINKKKEEERNKIRKNEQAYLALKNEADALISSGKDIEKMSNKELTTILKSLKRNGDKRLPTKKNEMLKTYEEWKDRPPLEFHYEVQDADTERTETDNDCSNDDDDDDDDVDNFESV